MRAFVFPDPALAKRAGQFVWLSVNTELAGNTPFLKKYPVQAWPSFYVISPDSETVVYRWMGGATVAQMEKILDDGLKAGAVLTVRAQEAGNGTAKRVEFKALVRIDTPEELVSFTHGGILPYVLRQLVAKT